MAEYKRLKSADTVLALCFALLATTIDERFDTFLEIPPQKKAAPIIAEVGRTRCVALQFRSLSVER
jgi:hypothetical protein